MLNPEARRAEARALQQTLVDPPRPGSFSVDFVRTEQAWDDRRRLWQVSRRAVRVTVPLQELSRQASPVPLSLKLTWTAIGAAFVAAMAILISTLGASGAAKPQAPASSVEIELDPPSVALPKPIAKAPAPPPMPVAAPVAAEPAGVEPAAIAAAVPAEPEPPAPARVDSLESVRQAFAKAIETGVAEPWSENGLSGYVVVGPSTLSDKSVCRNLAIWLDRPGGSGQVVDGEKCLAADGRWFDP